MDRRSRRRRSHHSLRGGIGRGVAPAYLSVRRTPGPHVPLGGDPPAASIWAMRDRVVIAASVNCCCARPASSRCCRSHLYVLPIASTPVACTAAETALRNGDVDLLLLRLMLKCATTALGNDFCIADSRPGRLPVLCDDDPDDEGPALPTSQQAKRPTQSAPLGRAVPASRKAPSTVTAVGTSGHSPPPAHLHQHPCCRTGGVCQGEDRVSVMAAVVGAVRRRGAGSCRTSAVQWIRQRLWVSSHRKTRGP